MPLLKGKGGMLVPKEVSDRILNNKSPKLIPFWIVYVDKYIEPHLEHFKAPNGFEAQQHAEKYFDKTYPEGKGCYVFVTAKAQAAFALRVSLLNQAERLHRKTLNTSKPFNINQELKDAAELAYSYQIQNK